MRFISSKDQLADLFTKVVSSTQARILTLQADPFLLSLAQLEGAIRRNSLLIKM
jgi:hypothetical protein